MNGEAGNAHTGLEIGRTLRLAREKRGLSVRQVEEATKIRARYLRDLENENFDVLPAVYVLGSLKTYAQHLGLDGAAMAAELKRRQRPPLAEHDETGEVPPTRKPRGLLASVGSLIGIGKAAEDEAGMVAGPVRSTGPYVGLAMVLVFIFATFLAPSFGEEGQPPVTQVREPKISQTPSMLARASDLLVDEPYNEGGNVDYPSEKPAQIHTRETAGDDIAEAVAGEQVNHPPETAQVSPSSATSFESEPASASASASASAAVHSLANAAPASTVSTPTPTTTTPTRARPEPATREETPGDVAATPASPPALAPGSLRVHKTQVNPIDPTSLDNTISEQDHQRVEESRELRVVSSQEITQRSTIREPEPYQH